MRQDALEVWVAGQLALALLAIDPDGLGGVHVRARADETRARLLSGLPAALPPERRIAPGIDDAQLSGGIDIAASLAAGRRVTQAGLLARPATLVLSMAERCPRGLAARLGQALDARAGHALILLDEGIDTEVAPEGLTDRLAFALDLSGVRAAALTEIALEDGEIASARRRLRDVELADDALEALVHAAARLGVPGLRAVLFAAAAARAHAALSRRDAVGAQDLQIAAQLVLAPRATMLPEPEEDDADDQPEPESPEDAAPEETGDALPEELLIEAVRALLPPGVLEARAARAAQGAGSGQGARRRGTRRGRPLPSRPGRPSSEARIDLVATLRAAAPWQALRREGQPGRPGVIVRRGDIHVRRYEDRADRLVIFCVDASGSAALARMAEAKGAVELMLAEAYAKRDRVALVTFRGTGAELALPPTRSLVQAKRRLAGLPGGGGTPLAAGLAAVHALAIRAARQGMTPAVALLTDGRANVPLDGRSGRAAARADSERMAALLGALQLSGAVIDTGTRPNPDLAALAGRMGLPALALPRSDAAAVRAGISDALGD
ncbi:magnesium chelatase subunit D [Roseivivax isoporae]|uniref:VWFA domain-containing protein n=1 Tax=Roseivivax isoporae LMG 25204 TaxID=1449351 RepID=X7F709_9RHOB|nr:magnesium chelatase subunit D [Roseivivax isoporae]ETX28707.1 hypothetical protein RISW2_05255 [Roseivivax isoporae LMG 25204]